MKSVLPASNKILAAVEKEFFLLCLHCEFLKELPSIQLNKLLVLKELQGMLEERPLKLEYFIYENGCSYY